MGGLSWKNCADKRTDPCACNRPVLVSEVTDLFDTQNTTVICAGPHLTEIHVSGNGLKGTLPDAMTQLTALKKFDGDGSQFAHGALDVFSKIMSLQYLWLEGCSLIGTIPDTFPSQLHTLYLNGNSLNGSIPESFAELFNLKKLYLGENSSRPQCPIFHSPTILNVLFRNA